MGEKANLLNDIANGAAELNGIPGRDVAALHNHRSGGIAAKAVDQFKQGSLAAATFPKQGQCFALMNRQRNAGKNGSGVLNVYLVLDVLEFDDSVFHGCGFYSSFG